MLSISKPLIHYQAFSFFIHNSTRRTNAALMRFIVIYITNLYKIRAYFIP